MLVFHCILRMEAFCGISDRGEEAWRELKAERWTDCMRLCVHVYCCDSSYLSFILLQSCRCDTGAVVERAGEVWVPRGAGSLPAREEAAGGCRQVGDIPSSLSRARARVAQIGGCYGWVRVSEVLAVS